MKAFKGTFKKKNGETREMVFSRIGDLPNGFVAARITGAGNETKYPKGMELVWDLESDNFRIFNYNTALNLEELEVDSSLYIDYE